MSYKLVVLDIDGTLLDSQGKIPNRHKEIVQKAQESGIHVVLATGRYYMQAKWIIDELDYQGILVSNDGSVLIDTNSNDIVYERSFSTRDVSNFIKSCRAGNVQCVAVTAFDYYVEFSSKDHEENCIQHGVKYTLCDDLLDVSDNVMKFSIMDTAHVGGWQDHPLPRNLRLRVDSEYWKEFMHSNATKANGLKEVLLKLNVEPSEMIAIGDFYNDLDMLEYAGMGIAMGNASDDVKARANDVTSSNDEDGVYHALNKYLFA